MNRFIPTLLIISALALVCMGVVMIASTGPWAKLATSPTQFQFDHQKNLTVGLALFFVAYHCRPEWIRKFAPILYLIGIGLLAACYLPIEAHSVNGSARWVKIPFLPRFQASDIGKITSIIGLAYYYAQHTTAVKTFIKGFVIPGLLFAIPVLLILFEEDMDTAALLGLVGAACMYLIGVRQRFLIPVALVAIACGTVLVNTNANRKQRLSAFDKVEQFHQTDKKTQDVNRQQWHALLAFGRGGPSGAGLGNSQEKHGYLPEAHTDFVLAVAAEEFGLTMTLSIVFCFILLGGSGFYIAAHSQRMFSRILAAGLTLLILLPALINITVNTAKMPVAGLPLPFISYGGTNLIAMIGSIAVLLAIHRENRALATEEEPEITAPARPFRL
jgi:cell division protein FtsW